MAKDKQLNLNVNVEESGSAQSSPKTNPQQQSKKPKKEGPTFWQKIAKVFREIISELKKVDWPPFRQSKNRTGVLPNLGIVLVVVLVFLVVITAFDAGLGALLKLLTKIS
jgi:preprotein translocase SecE subunit